MPTDTAGAQALFDSASAIPLEFMFGTWRASALPTGHWMDGAFEALGFWGKGFIDSDTVHPLLFPTRDRRALWAFNPGRMPQILDRVALDSPRLPSLNGRSMAGLMTLLRPVGQTKRPRARLRTTAYRGEATATMIYDQHPVNDVFRKLAEDVVIGVMDVRGQRPFYFLMQRDDSLPILSSRHR